MFCSLCIDYEDFLKILKYSVFFFHFDYFNKAKNKAGSEQSQWSSHWKKGNKG